MKTSNEIKAANLLFLKRIYGTWKALGEAVNYDPSMLSNIANPSQVKRNMGNDVARKIEKALGKPTGWMDQEHATNQEDSGESPIEVKQPGTSTEDNSNEQNPYSDKVNLIAGMLQRREEQYPELLDAVMNVIRLVPDNVSHKKQSKLITKSDVGNNNKSTHQ